MIKISQNFFVGMTVPYHLGGVRHDRFPVVFKRPVALIHAYKFKGFQVARKAVSVVKNYGNTVGAVARSRNDLTLYPQFGKKVPAFFTAYDPCPAFVYRLVLQTGFTHENFVRIMNISRDKYTL